MARACHALAADGRVWLVDPVDQPAAMAAAGALGEPAGVLQLLDRHNGDYAAIAARLGIPRVVNPDALMATPFEPCRSSAGDGGGRRRCGGRLRAWSSCLRRWARRRRSRSALGALVCIR